MNKHDAVKVYLSKNAKARSVVMRIMEWSPELTIKENALRLRMGRVGAYMLQCRYGLKSKDKREK